MLKIYFKILTFILIISFTQGCLEESSQRGGHEILPQYTRAVPEEVDVDEEEEEDPAPIRPTNEVYIQSDFCACQDGKPAMVGNCYNFCATKTDTNPTLYINTLVGPQIELMFGSDIARWCGEEIEDGYTGPKCLLKMVSENDSQQLDLVVTPGSKQVQTTIQSLSKDVTYIGKIVVYDSGGERAQSDSFQIRRTDYEEEPNYPTGVLKIMPVHRYHCIFRAISVDNSGTQEITSHVGKVNFFYSSNTEPPPIPFANAGSRFYYCHDIQTFGLIDSSATPRLGLEQNFLTVWDQGDPRFYETMSPGKLDIDYLIEKKLQDEYNITSSMKLFQPFSWVNYPGEGGEASVGFYMVPWMDPISGITFCPTQEHYNGSRPEFKVLKEFIGVDTEGLYFATKDPETVEDENHNQIPVPNDIMLIRENLLTKIWFYYDQVDPSTVRHVMPDELTARQKTIHFYWPPIYDESGVPVEPFLKKAHQRVYTIMAGDDATSIIDGNRTTMPTSDKRFGCIPVKSE